jgi:nucleoside-triphosphatase THEP1
MTDCAPSPAHMLATALITSNSLGLWIATGQRGVGKSTWCATVIEQARAAGWTVQGLLCPAVFEQGTKIGIDLIDLESGERRRLGNLSRSGHEDLEIGRWFLKPATIAWGNEVLKRINHCDLIVLDELGAFEFERGGGFQEGLRLLDEHRFQRALAIVRSEWLPVALARWPQAQVIDLGENP